MIIRNYKNIDGIFVFDEDISNEHEDYQASGLDGHKRIEEKHFWFVARRGFLLGRFNKFIDKKSRIIEIGAGTGNVAHYLMKNGFENMCVGEMHKNGLEYARQYGLKGLYQFDLLRPTFQNEFDVVCMFDVLEHLEGDGQALLNAHKMLKLEGKIVLAVPAHKWLWSSADHFASHKRRYTRNSLTKLFLENGFEVVEIKYFFILLTPFLFLRKLLSPDKENNTKDAGAESMNIHPVLNKALLGITWLENRLFDFFPNFFGGSLYAVAKKKV